MNAFEEGRPQKARGRWFFQRPLEMIVFHYGSNTESIT
jgi:hypothetical protein